MHEYNMSESNTFCVKCGAKLELNNNFCPKCGSSVLSDVTKKETITKKPISKKKSDTILTKMYLLVCVGLFIILLGTLIISAAMEMSVLFAGQYLILGLFVCVMGGVIMYGATRIGKKKSENVNPNGKNQ